MCNIKFLLGLFLEQYDAVGITAGTSLIDLSLLYVSVFLSSKLYQKEKQSTPFLKREDATTCRKTNDKLNQMFIFIW